MLERRVSLALAIAGLLAVATTGAAQEALVLSTGASKGLAHAGVVAGLEERGYDPDLVVGSSMGAVIGGLYASGHTPEEIVRLLKAVDWKDIFKPMPLLLGPGRSVRLPLLRLGLALEPWSWTGGSRPTGGSTGSRSVSSSTRELGAGGTSTAWRAGSGP